MGGDGKKEIRQSLTPMEWFLTLLMPISQGAGWYLALNPAPLQQAVGGLALFHAAWAVRNRFTGNSRERGMYTMGLTALGCFGGASGVLPGTASKAISMLGAASVMMSYAVVIQRILMWPPSKLAYVSKKTVTWAKVLKANMVSGTMLWSYILLRMWQDTGAQ